MTASLADAGFDIRRDVSVATPFHRVPKTRAKKPL